MKGKDENSVMFKKMQKDYLGMPQEFYRDSKFREDEILIPLRSIPIYEYVCYNKSSF